MKERKRAKDKGIRVRGCKGKNENRAIGLVKN
jgi:hypothetical protein